MRKNILPLTNFFRSNSLVKNSFWSLGSGMVDRFSALLALVILARLMDKESYGIFIFLITTLNLLANTVISGPANIFIREVSGNRKNGPHHVPGLIALGVFWCLLIGVAVILITLFFNKEVALYLDPGNRISGNIIKVIGPWAGLITLSAVFSAVIQGYELFSRSFFAYLGKSLTNIVLCVCLALFYGLWGAIAAYIITAAVFLVLLWMISDHEVKWKFQDGINLIRTDKAYVSKVIQLSFPLIMLSFVQMGADWGGQFLLAKGGKQWAAVADLGVARQIAFILPVLSSAVASAGLPHFSRKINEGPDNYFQSVVNYIRTSWFMQIPVGAALICVAPFVVTLIYGKAMATASDICRILVISYTIFGLTGTIGPVLTSKGKTRLLLLFQVIRAVSILLFCYLFLAFEGYGIALGYLAGESVLLLIVGIAYFRYVKRLIIEVSPQILQLVPVLIAAALSFFTGPWVALFILAAALGIEFIIFKDLILSMINKSHR